MIIYFSGTGNSLYVAKKLLSESERLVSIADCMKQNDFSIELEKDENLGFVFPVYFYTVPSIVREFIEKAEIGNAGYVYSVITCGGGTGQASSVLKKLLAEKGIVLSYFKEILMPDNSMLFYQIPGTEKAGDTISRADTIIETVGSDIKAEKTTSIGNGTAISDLMNLGYKMCSVTKKFYAEDTCTGCGLCERNCPQQVIKLENNKPVWTKENCCKCSSCINRCPVKAIQYGKGTKHRNRYVNPYE